VPRIVHPLVRLGTSSARCLHRTIATAKHPVYDAIRRHCLQYKSQIQCLTQVHRLGPLTGAERYWITASVTFASKRTSLSTASSNRSAIRTGRRETCRRLISQQPSKLRECLPNQLLGVSVCCIEHDGKLQRRTSFEVVQPKHLALVRAKTAEQFADYHLALKAVDMCELWWLGQVVETNAFSNVRPRAIAPVLAARVARSPYEPSLDVMNVVPARHERDQHFLRDRLSVFRRNAEFPRGDGEQQRAVFLTSCFNIPNGQPRHERRCG
jgi:hypothetical protein